MKPVRSALALVAVLLMVSPPAFSQVPAVRPSSRAMSPQAALDALASTNRSERLKAVTGLDAQWRQSVKTLLAILDSSNSAPTKVDAVVVLGQYRAAEAVPLLVRHFELDDVYPTPTGGGGSGHADPAILESHSPVSGALWQIGTPAIPALLDTIADTGETNITAKCVRICYQIEGREITQFRLQRFQELAGDPKKKDRIGFALGILRALKPEEGGFAGAPEWLNGVVETDAPNTIGVLVDSSTTAEGSEMTQFRLQRLLEKETDPARKARIQSALDYLNLEKTAPLTRPGEASTNAVPAIAGQSARPLVPEEKGDISYHFEGLPLDSLLKIYEDLAGENVTMKAMPNPVPVVRLNAVGLTKSQARRLLEEALKAQAGLVIVRGRDGSLSAVPNP